MIRHAAKALARLVLAEEIATIKREYDTHESTLYAKMKWEEWRETARRFESERDEARECMRLLKLDLERVEADRESARLIGELNAALSAECQDAKARADAGESLYDAVKGFTEPDDWAPSLTDLAKAQATYERAAFGKVSEHLAHAAPVIPANANPCGCWACLGDKPVWHMVLCPTCGNKRCPKANDHKNECSGSNEPGQKGSAYE